MIQDRYKMKESDMKTVRKPTEVQASILLEWLARGNCKDPLAERAILDITSDWFVLSRLVDSMKREMATMISKIEGDM